MRLCVRKRACVIQEKRRKGEAEARRYRRLLICTVDSKRADDSFATRRQEERNRALAMKRCRREKIIQHLLFDLPTSHTACSPKGRGAETKRR